MKSPPRTEQGQALIMIVFVIIGLIGVTALAVDGGNAYSDRQHAQNAADSAALAGALARVGNTGNWITATYQKAADNGYDNDGVTNVVKISSPPASGPYKGNFEYIQVQITSHVKTYFASVLGVTELTNRVEATSFTKPAEYKPILGGAAIISLSPTSDCGNKKSFYVHSEATLDITGSGVFINSNNPDCALIQRGEGSIRINDGHPIQIVGGASIQKPKLLTPYPPDTSAPPVTYPPPFYMPKFGCPEKAEVSADGESMSPGNWDDDFPPPGVHRLRSGVYCLNKDFKVNGKLKGNGVLFKIEHGRVQITGHAQVNLSAKMTGDLAGLLFYQPIDNTNTMVLGGDSGSVYKGTILAPGAQIRIKGPDKGSGFHSQVVGYTIDVDGDSDIVIKFIEDQIYKALTYPEVQFVQ